MKADKPLEWSISKFLGKDNYQAKTEFHGFGEDYTVRLDRFTQKWFVFGVGRTIGFLTKEEAMQVAQDHYNRHLQLKAWEDYMLSHDPPKES